MTFGKLERRTFNFMSDTTNTRKYEGYELDEIWEDEDEYIEDDETESER